MEQSCRKFKTIKMNNQQRLQVGVIEASKEYQDSLNEYLNDGINYQANTIKNAGVDDLKQLAADSFHAGMKFILSTPPLPVGELNKMAEERAVEMYKYQDGPDHSWDAMQNQRRQGFKDGFIVGYTARTRK